MAVKYTIPFKDIANRQCRIDIGINTYTGDPINIRGVGGTAVSINWQGDGQDKPDNVIVSSSASINLYNYDSGTGLVDVLEIQESGDRDFIVQIYVSELLVWQGFILPDGIQQPYKSMPYNLTFNCSDGMGLLEGIDYFYSLTSDQIIPGVSNIAPIHHVRRILWERLGINLPIQFTVNGLECNAFLGENIFAGSVEWGSSGRAYIEPAEFEDEVVYKDCRWVLEALLKCWKCRIYQSGGKWVVERLPDIITGNYTSMVLTSPNILTTESINVNKGIGRDLDYPFINEDAYLTSKKPIKKIKVTYNNTQRDNLLPNGNMDVVIATTNSVQYWIPSIIDSYLILQPYESLNSRPGNSLDVKFSSGGSIGLEQYVSPSDGHQGLPIDMNILYKTFRFSFSFLPLNGFLYYTSEANGHLDGEIDWSNNPMRISLTTYLVVNGVVTEYCLNQYGYWYQKQVGSDFNRYNYSSYESTPGTLTIDSYFSGSPIPGDWISREDNSVVIRKSYVPVQYSNDLVGFLNFAGQDQVDNTDAIDFQVVQDGMSGYILRINRPSGGLNVIMNWGLSDSLRDGTISFSVGGMKIGDIANVSVQSKDILFPDPGELPYVDGGIPQANEMVGKLFVRLYVKSGQRIVFDDVKLTVNDNKDVYEISVSESTSIEEDELNASTAFTGFYDTNFMTSWSKSGIQCIYSNGIEEGTMTNLYARDTVRMFNKSTLLFNGTINTRRQAWSFGECYNIYGLEGKKFLPLSAQWNVEKCECNLGLFEGKYDTGLLLNEKHYGSDTDPLSN